MEKDVGVIGSQFFVLPDKLKIPGCQYTDGRGITGEEKASYEKDKKTTGTEVGQGPY